MILAVPSETYHFLITFLHEIDLSLDGRALHEIQSDRRLPLAHSAQAGRGVAGAAVPLEIPQLRVRVVPAKAGSAKQRPIDLRSVSGVEIGSVLQNLFLS